MQGKISTESIIKMLQLPKVGRKTSLKLIDNLAFSINSEKDLSEYIKESASILGLPQYSEGDFEKAYSKAEEIISNSEKKNIKIISCYDIEYPAKLREIDDFPILLNYIGNIKPLNDKNNVAVIGTREPTEYGIKLGKRLGEVFAANGFNVVSGLAIGCDTAGHIGALVERSTTTAVLAHGLDTIYPKENKALADQILSADGLLISEYFVKQRAMGNFFVERDRIQAGLSDSVIVVETDIKGGTMHTVKYCLKYQRILACLNHPTEYHHEPKVQGNRMLINEKKAIPIISKEDIDNIISLIRGKNPLINIKDPIQKDNKEQKKSDNDIQYKIWED